jgi:hypothetical protein
LRFLIPDAEDAKVTQKTQKRQKKISENSIEIIKDFLGIFLFGIPSAQPLRLLRPVLDLGL